jgi:hypothetical protein
MAFTTLNLGLELTIPTNGTRSWGSVLYNTTWTKISNHRHQGAGDGAQIPTAGIADYSITTVKLSKNYGYTQASTLTPVGTTQTVDFNLGNVQFLNVGSASGDVTLTLSNPATGSIYYIWITQGATARDVIWPASVKWPQAQKPILSTVSGKVDMVKLYYTGTEYRGVWELDFS